MLKLKGIKMLNKLANFFVKRQMKALINGATMAIYSDLFDIDVLSQKLAGSGNSVCLLRTFIAIRVAADIKVKGKTPIMGEVLEEVLSAELNLQDAELCQSTLDLYKAKADVSLAKAEIEFEIEKLAPEDSYKGIIYQAEKAKRGPLSYKERIKIRKLTDEIDELNAKLSKAKETEANEILLNGANKIRNNKSKAERLADIKRHGERVNEILHDGKYHDEFTEKIRKQMGIEGSEGKKH
jgi:hypothetical protein